MIINIEIKSVTMTHYHFVGIKGAGMSSLAQIMHDLGNEVQGSDIKNYVLQKSH